MQNVLIFLAPFEYIYCCYKSEYVKRE
jgi:hypothetical protein